MNAMSVKKLVGEEIEYGQRHQELLAAYENILRKYGADPISDAKYYKLLMKLDLQRERGKNVFEEIQYRIKKSLLLKVAHEHYVRSLYSKAYFILVQNMVSSAMIQQLTIQQAEFEIPKVSHQFSTAMSSSTQATIARRPVMSRYNTGQQVLVPMNGKENLKESEKLNNSMKALPKASRKTSSRSKSKGKKKSGRTNDQQRGNHFGSQQANQYHTIFTTDHAQETQQQTIIKSVSQMSLAIQNNPKSTLHSGQGSIDNRTDRIKASKTSQDQSLSFNHLSDFKLILKILRAWKSYTRVNRDRRLKQKQRFIENLAVSIHYNQQTLLNKSILALQQWRVRSKRRGLVLRVSKRRHENRLKKVCFTGLKALCFRMKLKKEQVFKAMYHWSTQQLQKAYQGWHSTVQSLQQQKDRLFLRMLNHPISIRCLMAIANYDIQSILKEKGKEDSVDQRMIRVALSRFFSREIFRGFKSLLYRDGVKISNWHQRYLFRACFKPLVKNAKLKKIQKAYFRQKLLIQKIQSFRHWQSLYQEKNIIRKLDEISSEHREKVIKFKVIRGLLMNMQDLRMRKSQMQASVNTKMNKLLQTAYEGWKFVTLFNRKYRAISTTFKTNQQQKSKVKYFYTWIQTALQLQKARIFHSLTLTRKSFSSILLFINQKELKGERLQSLRDYRSLHLRKQVFSLWSILTLRCKKERHLRRQVQRWSKTSKMKLCLNGWRMAVQELINQKERVVQIREYMQKRKMILIIAAMRECLTYEKDISSAFDQVQAHYALRIQRSVLKLWSYNYLRQLGTKGKTHTLASRLRQKQLHKNLKAWYILTNLRVQRKLALNKLRIRNRLRACFKELKIHANERKAFRARLHRFLRIRATFLLHKSFSAITSFTRERLLKIKLNKVAKYIHFRRLLLMSFSHLKAFHIRQQHYKILSFKQSHKTLHSTLNRWKTEYLRTDIGKKLSKRRDTVKLFKCFHQLKAKTNSMRRLRLVGNQILAKKNVKREQKVMKTWQLFRIQHKKKVALRNLSIQYNQQRLEKKCFRSFLYYRHMKSQKKLERAALLQARQQKLAYGFFSILKTKQLKSKTQKLILDPIREKSNYKLVTKALSVLYQYAYYRHKVKVRKLRADKKYQKRLKGLAFSVLLDELLQKKEYKLQVQTAKLYDEQRVMRKAIYSFIKYKLLNRYSQHVIKVNQLTVLHRFMSSWYELFIDCQGQKALFEIAERHYLQKIFSRFLTSFQLFKVTERVKRSRTQKANHFYHLNLGSYTFGLFKLFLTLCREKRLKIQIATHQRMQNVFNSWLQVRSQLQKSKMDRYLANGYRRQKLMSHGLLHMAIVVNDRKAERIKVRYVQKIIANNIKRHVYKALHDNIGTQQRIRDFLQDKLSTFSRILLKSSLLQWHSKLLTLSLQDTADWFHHTLWPRTLARRCLTALSLYSKHSSRLGLLSGKLTSRVNKALKGEYMVRWVKRAGESRAERERIQGVEERRREGVKKRALLGLQRWVLVKQSRRNQGEQAQVVRYSTLARKALVAIQRNQCVQQTAKYVNEKRLIGHLQNSFGAWRHLVKLSNAGRNLCGLLEVIRNKFDARLFLRKLARFSLTQRTYEYIQNQKVLRRCLLFFDILRTRVIYKRIIQSWAQARDHNLKQHIFSALKDYKAQRVQQYSILELQVDNLLEESNRELVMCSFASLQINARQGRLKRVAKYRYRVNLMRKGILSMALATQKSKILRYGTVELEVKRKARFFVLWYEAIATQRTAQVARKVLNLNKLGRILDQWRLISDRSKRAGAYHENNFYLKIVPQVFSVLKNNAERSKYLRYCSHEISKNRAFMLMKHFMLAWLQYLNLKKISFNMRRYYQFKQIKTILDSWRLLNLKNSSKRKTRFHIRETLNSNPHLAKPLFALKNLPLYHAFQTFKQGISESSRLTELKKYSHVAYYLKKVRFAFEIIHVNAIQAQQKRNARVINDIMVMRRWFGELREAVRVSKWCKQARIESAIFNFLSIQRKGFNSLIDYAQTMKQERLKLMLATDIYAKSLLIKVFSTLRHAVLEKYHGGGTLDKEGTGYLIECDIAQFDHHVAIQRAHPMSSTETHGPRRSQQFEKTTNNLGVSGSGIMAAIGGKFINQAISVSQNGDRTHLYSTALQEDGGSNPVGGGHYSQTNNSNNMTMVMIEGAPTQELQDFIQERSFNEYDNSDDKLLMAEELYRKKRLYQSFIGWLSTLGGQQIDDNLQQ